MLKKGLARGVVVPGIVLKKTATFCVCRLTKQFDFYPRRSNETKKSLLSGVERIV